MAERIVSPGVFTRERDLSFLPQGVSEIGAAIVGPTRKGPSFVPTVVRNFEEFESIFGTYSSDYYTPFTVKNYLDSAGTVTIVKVGYLGGYRVSGFNLVVSGSGNTKFVVAQFLPSVKNNSGEGLISGSLSALPSASSFTLTLNGANATASVANLTLQESGTATGNLDSSQNFISKALPSSANAQKIGTTDAPAYMYKFFRSNLSASFANGTVGATSVLTIENIADNGVDFATGTESVDTSDGNYISTISGNSDAASARTPFILAQDSTELFRIYTRADGTDTNNHYAVIRDIKRPQNSNSSPDFAEFGLAVYNVNGNLVETYSNLNLDPDSGNYIVKVIGDEFSTVNNDGEITTYGDYPNLSRHIRVGDYKEDTFRSNPNLQPMGFAAVLDPIKSTAGVPSASFNRSQTLPRVDANSYKEDLPYGFKIDSRFGNDELDTNKAYLSPIPKSETAGNNVNFLLTNMKGFGDSSSSEFSKYTNFATSTTNLSISSSAQQLKFSVPFQHGFDGINPSHPKNTGTSISSANTMGFDISSATSSGSVAWKRAINAVSNPDEYDINMLVTPGIIHKHHNIISNHAIDKVEARADAFYVMDGSDIDDNVATAVNNVSNLDTNYVATYYPWVKMDDISKGSGTILVPPSVVIPGVIAFTDSVAHEWFAPAGLNRGGLTNVRMTKKKLTHTDRDTLYEGRVNPIASFPGQGVVVFGQKTLQARPSALDRINVRRLLIRLKKFIASSSRFLVFEQNDSSTRSRFLNIVNPFLESVQSNSGLSAFKVVMDDSNNTPDVIDRNQLVGQIFIQPTRTAEFIVLDFTVLPTGAAFPE